jgi:hypothetical protein
MNVQWAIPFWGWPVLVAVALACFAFVRWTYLASQPAPSPRLRRLLIALRTGALFLLLLAIAGPVLFRVRSEVRPAEVVLVLEDSSSMGLADEMEGRTRWQRALELTGRAREVLDGSGRRLTLLRGNGLGPLREMAPGEAASSPDRVGTDLDAVVREVAGRWAGRPLRGVVLLSDGNEAAGTAAAPLEGGPGLGDADFAVVGLGDVEGPPDRLIQDLRYPDVAFAGDEIVVDLVVATRATGADPAPAVQAQLRAAGRLLAEAEADGHEGVANLELSFPAEGEGLLVCELEVAPLDNERYLGNNRTTLAIHVRKQRTHLLCLAGAPGWDTRFLARAAHDEERLELAVAYRREGGLALADSGVAWMDPGDPAGWRAYDALVLPGWESVREAVDWESLRAAVTEGLGLLVLCEGEGDPPPPAPLAALLPVRLEGSSWLAGRWRLAPSGLRHPVLDGVVEADLPGGAARLDRLPPLEGVLAAAVRPGGVRLLGAARQGGQEGGGVREQPLLVLGRQGEGRVAWFGGRNFWELAFWESPLSASVRETQPAQRLLRNLLVWLTTGRDEEDLALVGHRRIYNEGERIRLEAQWRDMRGEPVTGRRLSLELEALDAAAADAPKLYNMQPVAGTAGGAAVVLPPLPPGRYRVQPLGDDDPPVRGRADHLVVTASSLEDNQVRQDRRRLRALGEALGGTYIAGGDADAPDRLAGWLERLPAESDTRVIRQRWDLWAGWPLLVAVVVLLGVEWFLRRRHSLL